MLSKTSTLLLSSTLLAAATAQDFPYPKPDKRYTPFESLSSDDQYSAKDYLGYTAITWNVIGLADVESLGWWQLSEAQKTGAGALGLTEDTWDCFIHHYLSYTWDELGEAGVQASFEALGWSEGSWEGSDASPDTESKWWGQLTDDEKTAAKKLCYFQDNWNLQDMTPNSSYFPFPFPTFRYTPWDELTDGMKSTAGTALAYTSGVWNQLGNNTAELNTYLNLDETERKGALDLGFYTHTWDCFMNHYDSYYWDALYGSTLIAMETLGWDEDMWTTRTDVPDSEITYWSDLTAQEKAAATALCYFEESWDGSDLTTFYDYSAKQTKAVPSTTEVPSDMDFTIFAGEGAPGSSWVPGQISVAQATSSSSMRAVSMSVTLIALFIGTFFSV